MAREKGQTSQSSMEKKLTGGEWSGWPSVICERRDMGRMLANEVHEVHEVHEVNG